MVHGDGDGSCDKPTPTKQWMMAAAAICGTRYDLLGMFHHLPSRYIKLCFERHCGERHMTDVLQGQCGRTTGIILRKICIISDAVPLNAHSALDLLASAYGDPSDSNEDVPNASNELINHAIESQPITSSNGDCDGTKVPLCYNLYEQMHVFCLEHAIELFNATQYHIILPLALMFIAPDHNNTKLLDWAVKLGINLYYSANLAKIKIHEPEETDKTFPSDQKSNAEPKANAKNPKFTEEDNSKSLEGTAEPPQAQDMRPKAKAKNNLFALPSTSTFLLSIAVGLANLRSTVYAAWERDLVPCDIKVVLYYNAHWTLNSWAKIV
ncbi:hypothetical protein ACJX0J_017343, partial [Zea mays]